MPPAPAAAKKPAGRTAAQIAAVPLAHAYDIEGTGDRPLDRQEAGRRRAEHRPSNAVRPAAASGPAERADPARPAPRGAGTADARPKAGRGPAAPAADDPGKALRAARTDLSPDLSPDGRLVLAALSEKIDRRMSRFTSAAKADLRRFVAAELLKKERTGGPVVLTAEQARAARAPTPARAKPDTPKPLHRTEPDPPHRSRSR